MTFLDQFLFSKNMGLLKIVLKNIMECYYKMTSLENLTIAELMITATLRKVDGCENISRQQLENICPTLPTPKPFPKFALRPNKFTPKKPHLLSCLKNLTPKKKLMASNQNGLQALLMITISNKKLNVLKMYQ